jgi:hypothetical protein
LKYCDDSDFFGSSVRVRGDYRRGHNPWTTPEPGGKSKAIICSIEELSKREKTLRDGNLASIPVTSGSKNPTCCPHDQNTAISVSLEPGSKIGF